MTIESFISVLVISATATSLAIEILKNVLKVSGIAYKTIPLAVVAAFIIGFVEMIIYTIGQGNNFTPIFVLYAICMGIANVIGSNVGYDKIKEFIYALMGK